MKFDIGTILVIGGVIAAGWCFIAGPCKGILGGLTGGGPRTNIGAQSTPELQAEWDSAVAQNKASIAAGRTPNAPTPLITAAIKKANYARFSI